MKHLSIIDNPTFKDNNPCINVLLETEKAKFIRITFKEGQVMKKHHALFPISIQLISGQIDFGVENEILNLNAGGLISLDGGVSHDLTAKKESIVLLTVYK